MTKRILTGVKPTGDQMHIGNYFGAIKPLLDLAQQDTDAEVFLFLANMHGLTSFHDGEKLKQNSFNVLKQYLACGADPDNFFIYNQADIAAHAQLQRVFNCITHMGFMERMHAYKDALQKGKANEISVGVFTYPILMAVDIVLYDADIVPVGKDQKQHVEFARDIAARFNSQFGDTFKIPDVHIQQEVATVPGIDGRKMSKSYNNYIGLMEEEKSLLKKIKQIATDTKTVEEPKDPDSCNVYNILKLFISIQEDTVIRKRYTTGGLSYKEVKDMLFEKIRDFLQPIQQRYTEVSDEDIRVLLQRNVQRANDIAQSKVTEVYKKVGFTL